MASIEDCARRTTGSEILSVPISAHVADMPSGFPINLDKNMTLPPTRTALLIFTSGTMGPPKGVLHLRKFFYVDGDPIGQEDDAVLFNRPALYIGAIRLLVNMLQRGIRIELWPYLYDPEMIWERLRKGDITLLHLLPTIWRKLMLVYERKADDVAQR